MITPRHILILLCLFLALATGACVGNTSRDSMAPSSLLTFEQEVLAEMNRARTNPTDYAAYIEATRKQLDAKLPPLLSDGNPHDDPVMRMFSETIEFLTSSRPLPALALSKGMSAAARGHLQNQMGGDHLGHTGRNGSTLEERLKRYGSWEVGIAGTMVYGSPTAKRLVMQQVIDYDNPDRRWRMNLFNPDFSVTGIACGSNAYYVNLCVIIFAGTYIERQ